MRELVFTIQNNQQIAKHMYYFVLTGDTSDIMKPGQFVNIQVPGFFLRRPISVCDWRENELTLIYKIVGGGTEALSKMSRGQKLSILSGLGNGYELCENQNPFIIGGGAGIPPLYGLAKRLIEKDITPKIILGFNNSDEIFYVNEFQSLGLDVTVTTLDGSYGVKGLVTDVIDNCEYAYVCGPLPMLKAVHQKVSDGQFSFEARMGCGFGVCMGCSMKIKDGYKRICKDGPVLNYSEILWDEN